MKTTKSQASYHLFCNYQNGFLTPSLTASDSLKKAAFITKIKTFFPHTQLCQSFGEGFGQPFESVSLK